MHQCAVEESRICLCHDDSTRQSDFGIIEGLYRPIHMLEISDQVNDNDEMQIVSSSEAED